MSAQRSSDNIPLPFVTSAIAFLISLYYPHKISAPIAAIVGFLVGVGVLYLIGKIELHGSDADDNSFTCPECGTALLVTRDHRSVFNEMERAIRTIGDSEGDHKFDQKEPR